jgi:hypothetical protein
MGPLLSVLESLVEDCLDVGHRGALNDHQVLNEKPVLQIPPAVQLPRRRVQEIPQLFIIDLCERGLDVELLFSLCHNLPEVSHGPRDDTLRLIRNILISSESFFHT